LDTVAISAKLIKTRHLHFVKNKKKLTKSSRLQAEGVGVGVGGSRKAAEKKHSASNSLTSSNISISNASNALQPQGDGGGEALPFNRQPNSENVCGLPTQPDVQDRLICFCFDGFPSPFVADK